MRPMMALCRSRFWRMLRIQELSVSIVLKRIPVSDLMVGMYIHEFCGSWMDHPFWKGRFLLDSERDLQRVRESDVAEVWIDVAKGVDVAEGQASQTVAEVEAEAERRLQEAARLGYKRAIVPRGEINPVDGMQVRQVATLGEALATVQP